MQFNDPNWAKAASNLAAAFAPPSGQDAAGFARAGVLQTQRNAMDAEAQRLAELYRMASGPDFDQDQFDRMGMAVGNWNPNQSYHAVGVQDATQRRGQDVSAQTAQAVAAANNARALQQTQMQNQAGLVGTFFGPHSEGQVGPAVPEGVASLFGLPAIDERRGAPRPLTATQQEAVERQGLIESGQLTDEMLLESILGERSPVEAVGPDGQPRFMSPGAAVRTGAQPAATGDASAAEDRIGRLTENLMATGTVVDPAEARNASVAIVDGRYRLDRDPTTREVTIVDMATGQPVYGGTQQQAQAPAATSPEGEFGEPFADPTHAFGATGFGAGVINQGADVLGLDQPFPETAETQRDFNVLREDVMNMIADAYGRQPPSWLMKEIRSLIPSAGSLTEGPATAQGKLNSLGRLFESEMTAADEALTRQLSPTERQAAEARKAGLEQALGRIGSALRSFERARPPGGGGSTRAPRPPQPPEPQRPPSPGDVEDGYRFRGGDPGDPNNWERAQ